MAFVCGWIVQKTGKAEKRGKRDVFFVILSCVAGALTYVALYMLKTFIFQAYVYGFPMDTVMATLISKLIPSLINALVAVLTAPVFYHAVLPAMRHTGVLTKIA